PATSFVYVAQPGRNSVAEFQNGALLSLQQELPIDPAFTPVYVVGVPNAPRIYAISQSNSGGNGRVSTIEATSNTIDATPIPVGKDPVYGVMTPDARRAFIMNQGSNSISVINSQTNQLDTPLSTIKDPQAVGPLWAD